MRSSSRGATLMAGIAELKGFRTLSPAHRTMVAAATREQSSAKGATIFIEGRPAESLWAVKAGLIHIVKSGPEGSEIVLEVIPPGELFGAVAALESRPYPASAVAAEDSVVWRLPARLARELCQKHPTLHGSILEDITCRLRNAHERLRSVALERVEQRLARVLLSLAEKIGEHAGGEVALKVRRRELADMIGATVETTVRVTTKWQQAGIISSSRGKLGLIDLERLKAIAEGHR